MQHATPVAAARHVARQKLAEARRRVSWARATKAVAQDFLALGATKKARECELVALAHLGDALVLREEARAIRASLARGEFGCTDCEAPDLFSCRCVPSTLPAPPSRRREEPEEDRSEPAWVIEGGRVVSWV